MEVDNKLPENLRYHSCRVAVTREFSFEAAHKLEAYEGDCKNLHGHSYQLLITLSGYPDARGLVLDFAELKRLFEQSVGNRLDHCYLNDSLPPMNTTVENIVVWIWEEVSKCIRLFGWHERGLRLEELTLAETAKNSVKLTRQWVSEGDNCDK